MRRRMLMSLAILIAAGAPALAIPRHHVRHHVRQRYVAEASDYDVGGARVERSFVRPFRDVRPPLAGTVGTAIPREAARFMGYPYNMPGYRYEFDDPCLLRVGGPFGPGPSIVPCPLGLDRLGNTFEHVSPFR